ncbi:MAG: malto-oligosyltrehalose trehalohydrolase [Planctomycetota bacterium]
MPDARYDAPDARLLVTDLDGTLIPRPGAAEDRAALATLAEGLAERGAPLVFATGRHLSGVREAIERFGLPQPAWAIAEVGTAIYRREPGGAYQRLEGFAEGLRRITAAMPVEELRAHLAGVPGLVLQDEEKQGPFKLSFYCEMARVDSLVEAAQARLRELDAPYSVISSVDVAKGRAMIDLLAADVSKAYAVRWLLEHAGHAVEETLYAGDSGNDLAALSDDWRAVVVGNADAGIARQAHDAHRREGRSHHVYTARGGATTGVLEGCRWFGLVDSAHEAAPPDRLGATPITHRRTAFRVWAPAHWSVEVVIEGDGNEAQRHVLERDGEGCYADIVDNAPPGARYRYALGDHGAFPDPASRRQPEGVHGPSEVVRPGGFPWTDDGWRGVAKRDLIIYELHVGAFTAEGTFRAAIDRLPELVELGVTAVELLPINQTPGRWNWGYDGVQWFAPRSSYGEPDDLRALVDACHAHGLAVLLDVVYNHVGPEGNYLDRFGPYFSPHKQTPWGDALNYDGRRSEGARRLVIENALHWLDEYRLDGLRLDAVHYFYDDSRPSVLDELRGVVAEFGAGNRPGAGRAVHLIAESNVHDRQLLRPRDGAPPFDALWSDCLMHAVYAVGAPGVRLTTRGYQAGDLVQALRDGFLYHGPEYVRSRGAAPDDRPLEAFVTGLQTHDGVGNHPIGSRLHHLVGADFQRAAAALTLLHPSIPLLFMGEERSADAPFPFFADFQDRRLRRAVDKGRAREYPHANRDEVIRPSSEAAFTRAKCHDPNRGDPRTFAWYRELIALRKRGLAEGWLATDRMEVGADPARQLTWVRYRDGDGWVTIEARLVGAEASPAYAAAAESVAGRFDPAQVLACSNGVGGAGASGLTLARNHAVVHRA